MVLRYKLFAVDLDGTLLDRQGRVRPSDLQAMQGLRQAGVHVSIVTGRMYSGSLATAEQVGIDGPIACLDGGHIMHVGRGEELFHAPLPSDHAERVRGALRQHRPATFVMAHDQIVHDEHGEAYLPYVTTWSKQVIKHQRATEHPHWAHPRGVSQVVCVGPKEAILAVKAEVEQHLGEAVFAPSFPLSKPMLHGNDELWGMVVRASGQSKGTAVHWLARHHQISPDEVVVVGDWLNDLPMFREAGRSFAMGQAPDEVKQAATDVLDASVDTGGGIAEAARRAGLLP